MRRLVALALPGGPAFVEHLVRAWETEDAVLPVDLRLAAPAREQLLAVTRPSCVIDAQGAEHVLPGAEPVEEGDALVMATSGTTGEPKGVVLTHEAVAASARATNARLAVDPDSDAWWACLPLSHVGGLSVVTRSLVGDVRCEVGAGFSVEGARAALKAGATLTSLVPTTLRRLDPEIAEGFRRIVLGGQAPPSGLPRNVVTTYGMTETGGGLVYDGHPLDRVEVRIAGGEVYVRGPMLLRAYRDGSDPKDADGWLATGDGGEIGPEGLLSVHGRLSEMIISGGENIWPAAVEAVLLRHPAVAEAGVAGVADAEWGERVVSYVVLYQEIDTGPERLLEELRELVRNEIAPFAAPRQVVIVKAMPRTALGKIRRDELGELPGQSAAL
jgi:O-succinylbenzoic acid--CoA ligase